MFQWKWICNFSFLYHTEYLVINHSSFTWIGTQENSKMFQESANCSGMDFCANVDLTSSLVRPSSLGKVSGGLPTTLIYCHLGYWLSELQITWSNVIHLSYNIPKSCILLFHINTRKLSFTALDNSLTRTLKQIYVWTSMYCFFKFGR